MNIKGTECARKKKKKPKFVYVCISTWWRRRETEREKEITNSIIVQLFPDFSHNQYFRKSL